MAVLFILFAISMAVATFIEKDFGHEAAKNIVYNAKWFEVLLFLGIINLVSIIFRYSLYKKKSIFLFHFSFILIIIGAGITRYFGFEGTMHIREDNSSNIFVTEKSYLSITARHDTVVKEIIKPVSFSSLQKNNFHVHVNLNNQVLTIHVKEYYQNASLEIKPSETGDPIAELVFQGRNTKFLKQDEQVVVGNLRMAFSPNKPDSNTVKLVQMNGLLYFKASFPVSITSMTDQSVKMIIQDSIHRFYPRMVYNFNNQLVVLRSFLPKGKIVAKPSEIPDNNKNSEALLVELAHENSKKEFYIWGNRNEPGAKFTDSIHGINVTIAYGTKIVNLPFSIHLDDFILERYPGSNSPSWYESRVTLIDKNKEVTEQKRIYMNHILKHRGYRFYQASYDQDEKGTILSINYDWGGTIITYIGYILMAIGMVLSLFNNQSRFRYLFKESKSIKESKKAFLTLFIMLGAFFTPIKAQQPNLETIDAKHAKLFGELLVQDNEGRIKPVNSLSSEVLRKLARRNTYKNLSSDQVFLGILVNPNAWQHEPLIKVGHDKIKKILGTQEKYVPFSSFFSKQMDSYILAPYVNEANRKKPGYRNKFDNEIIRVDERVNIFYMVYSGAFLNVFPNPGDINNKWYSPVNAIGHFESNDSVFVNKIMLLYLEKVKEAITNGDWAQPNELLESIKTFQQKYGGKISPSQFRTKLEIFYNKAGIFERLSSFYGLIGFLMLILQFIGIFVVKLKLRVPTNVSAFLIVIAFILHTLTLAIRWYVSGHAPWGNGYEALTFIAWTTVLAGIIFSSRSTITLSTTAILAFLILHTAHLSWMDPQITNLVPVLKSYWLIIHVAVITASYGFLGMGALLALTNLLIMFLETKTRKDYIDLTIKEISNIVEMALIIGLYLLTIGTFLGGVWANESWGRYWGWDPKETCALITVIIYAFIVHMRLIPGLKGLFVFNVAALIGFGSVIMTYFGVNYYLTGLHSYATGDPLPIPMLVYYTIISIFLISILAYINQKRLNKNIST